MKKIVLKNEACIGCGACIGIDGEHFEFSEEGYSIIKSQENLDSPALSDAIDACPVAIISLEEVNEAELSEPNLSNEAPAMEETPCECEPCHCETCHHEDNTCHHEDNTCHHEDNTCYREDEKEAA